MSTHPIAQSRNSLRVLLVEDSRVYQVLAVRILEQHGFDVTVANNGSEAVRALQIDDYDVILMDIDMPVMNGLAATRHIRRQEDTMGGHIPIVAVTSNDNRDECMRAGMDAYLRKPLQADGLSRTLDLVLGPTAA